MNGFDHIPNRQKNAAVKFNRGRAERPRAAVDHHKRFADADQKAVAAKVDTGKVHIVIPGNLRAECSEHCTHRNQGAVVSGVGNRRLVEGHRRIVDADGNQLFNVMPFSAAKACAAVPGFA